MAETTKIEWCDATWNPWLGCTKVNEGCAHCYAERWAKRAGHAFGTVHRASRHTFDLPSRLEAGKRVFVCSLSDFFHRAADAWRDEAWAIMRKRRDLTFVIPTKRVELIASRLPTDWGWDGWPNVWLGASTPTQAWFNVCVSTLSKVPAAVRFVSMEPLLGAVDIRDLRAPRLAGSLDWVIVGGESGPQARPMRLAWVRMIRNACQSYRVPFFFKQWGEWLPESQAATAEQRQAFDKSKRRTSVPWDCSAFVGKGVAGRLLDGQEWSQFPGWNQSAVGSQQ